MSTFQSKLNDLYKTHLDRNVRAEGAGYWKDNFDDMIKAGVSETDAMAAIEANIAGSEEATNKPEHVKPELKSWQRSADTTGAGNFHTMELIQAHPEKKQNYTNTVTAYLEKTGILAGSSAMDTQVNEALGAATAADGIRGAMKYVPTGEERGDKWGTAGREYLLGEALKDNVDTSGSRIDLAENLINKLYTEGFGREADTGGMKYWTNQLYEYHNTGGVKGTSYADIAGNFLGSDEAKFRDVYHDEFGRDADDVGLQSWLSADKIEGTFKNIFQGSKEGQMRDLYSKHLGQHSRAKDRDDTYFTDVHEGGYKNLDWTEFTGKGLTGEQLAGAKQSVDFGHGSRDWSTTLSDIGLTNPDTVLTGLAKEEATMSVDDLRKLLEHKEKIQNIAATYDTDDAKGGTNIGRQFTVKELEEDYNLSDYEGNEDAYKALGDKLGGERWSILTKELKKFYTEPTKPGYDKDEPVLVDPGTPQVDLNQRNTHRNTLHSDYNVPVPSDYADKGKATVTREETDYMSKWDGSYGKKLDTTTYKAGKPKEISRSTQPFMASQSAQGVRRKRSGAFSSGASATGTGQFKRKDNMKIQSLNL